ncbi:MAG: hypothetical protein WCR30_03280 [Clostridia bacterium]
MLFNEPSEQSKIQQSKIDELERRVSYASKLAEKTKEFIDIFSVNFDYSKIKIDVLAMQTTIDGLVSNFNNFVSTTNASLGEVDTKILAMQIEILNTVNGYISAIQESMPQLVISRWTKANTLIKI